MAGRSHLVVFLTAVLSLIEASPAYAREDLVPGSRYTSTRGSAMGDAAIAFGDDIASGLFYNPANLGRTRRLDFEPVNLSFYGNGDYLKMLSLDSYKAFSLSSYEPILAQNPGKFPGTGMSIFPNFGFPGFSFGILMQSQLAATENANGTITYRSLYQFIPAMGTGYRFFDGVLRLGYSVQWVNQAVGGQTVANSGASYDQSLSHGSGLSHTLGAAVTLPVKNLPALNLVLRNILGTNYISYSGFPFSSASVEVPPTDPMSLDASFSIQHQLGMGAALNLVLEYRDMTDESHNTFLGHMAIGAEVSLRERVFLRAGWGGGYPSIGIGLKRSGSELSFSCYTEELGSHYLAQGDMRYLFQYQVGSF